MDHPDMPNVSSIAFNTETGTPPYGPHGVATGGIIGAAANNNIGISGVAPDVTLMYK